jgi:hypothetical protein
MKMSTFSKILTTIFLILCSLFLYSCKNNPGKQYENAPPITRLSNVPPTDSIITAPNPRLTLSWVGDDPDGYIIGYKYRWSYTIGGVEYHHQWARLLNISTVANFALMVDSSVTSDDKMFAVYHYFSTLPPEGLNKDLQTQLANGDSILVAGIKVFAANPTAARYPVHTNPTSGTFIFDSEDSLNMHKFEVAAIDDHGVATSPAAFVQFITPRVPPPTTQMVTPAFDDLTGATPLYVSDRVTDTWPGILFSFKATDPNSRTIQYSYSVDSLEWSPFTSATDVYVNASQFRERYGVRHTFSVRARNEFGSIDTLGYYTQTNTGGGTDTIRAKRVFYTMFPSFLQPNYQDTVLIFNASYAWDSTGQVAPSRPSSTMMQAFYSSLMDQIGLPYTITSFRYNGFPSRSLLSHYRIMIIAADDISEQAKYFRSSAQVFDATVAQRIIHDYAYIGGSLIISSINMPYAANTGNGDMFPSIFHANLNFIACAIEGGFIGTASSPDTSFIGATARIAGYPDVSLNPAKLDPLWNGGLFKIWSVAPAGFGEYLYTYNGATSSSCFNSQPIGIRYQGVSFNSIFLGFPLYYINDAQALLLLRKAISDCPRSQ